MPKKGHRAAVRQAQLSRKKRRSKGQPQVFASGPTEPEASTAVVEPLADPDLEPEPAPSTAQPAIAPLRRPRRCGQAEARPTRSYLGSELRKTGMITTLIVAILAVLTVFLRG